METWGMPFKHYEYTVINNSQIGSKKVKPTK